MPRKVKRKKPDEIVLPCDVEIVGQHWVISGSGKRADGVLGDCNPRDREISIDVTLDRDVLAETVLHEIVHACLSASGASYAMSEGGEERVAYMLSPVLLDALRRNPVLRQLLILEQQ